VRLVVVQETSAAGRCDGRAGRDDVPAPHGARGHRPGFHLAASAVLAILFDAPLEMANPQKRPTRPAPWAFKPSELLHYSRRSSPASFPGLVVLALVVIPHFDVNLQGVRSGIPDVLRSSRKLTAARRGCRDVACVSVHRQSSGGQFSSRCGS
jgi:hypothetical protein